MTDGMNRRRFLKVLGATGGGAVAAGCGTESADRLIPYFIPDEQAVPGVATWYASTCRECPGGCGLHVRVREGRAVKLEGNPRSPVNRGRLCARGQAALQGLYDPDRVRHPLARGADGTFQPIAWEEAVARVVAAFRTPAAGVLAITGHETGAFAALFDQWLALFNGRRLAYEPFAYEALREANRLTFGEARVPRYDFARARYVLSFGADFLATWLNPTTNALGFTAGHAWRDGTMGRCVYVDQRMGLTGMSADEWIAPHPGSDALVALAVAHVILRDNLGRPPADAGRVQELLAPYAPAVVAERTGVAVATLERLGREFGAADGALAVAGDGGALNEGGLALGVAVNLINYLSGNVGRTVQFGPDHRLDGLATYRQMTEAVQDMAGGGVGVALIHGANPAHTLPGALQWSDAFGRVPLKVSFATTLDETALGCDLVLPDHHPLEQWSDARPVEGVFALQQPVMLPVFDTRQTGDVLIQIAAELGVGAFQASFREQLRQAWTGLAPPGADSDTFWHDALRDGGVYRDVPIRAVRLADGVASLGLAVGQGPAEGQLVARVYPSSLLFDGRGANKAWLQEVPDPVTKVTWHSWVEMHPQTAADVGVVTGDIVEVVTASGSLEAPALVYDAIRPGVIGVPLGQGHSAYGRYAAGRGANAFGLLAPGPTAFGGLAFATAVTTVRFTGRHRHLATVEGSPRQHDREIARAMTAAAAAALGPGHAAEAHHVPWGEREQQALEGWAERVRERATQGDYVGEHPRWAMAIDLSRCTGCSACVAACYAENNIPAVGEELVMRGRELSWLRIERYWEGGEHGQPLSARVIPMLCQHCGNAPCEPVCPVFAAYHTPDGLNAQVYNRCVGTRYCANNCPYKVRYFNWFDYSGITPGPYNSFPEPLNWQLNPDVTVRTKGVMEKCTFCVQRIRERQHRARLEGRPLADGEILTACQQTCPSNAIVFGDLNDPDSAVRHASEDARGYHVFAELNTLPAITYLARVVSGGEA